MARKHGQTTYFIEGEGLVGEDAGEVVREEAPVLGEATTPDAERAFRFGRIFKDLPRFRPPTEGLIALGTAMDDTENLKDHPTLPAGFTYLGQFLDHDITFDKTQGLPSGELEPEEIEQGRSPSLDLDSVYGRGPHLEEKPIYQDDKVFLRIGTCSPVGPPNEPEGQALPNDVPRGHNPERAVEACIGDGRNDENLAVAQIHLAFLKFHNRVVESLRGETHSADEAFARARELVTLHYQWIVLHDFLPRVVEQEVLNDVLQNGRKFYQVTAGEEPTMPIEFSVAAYRFGHSMIRAGYSWNRNFATEAAGSLDFLFKFSGVSGSRSNDPFDQPMFGLPTLPANWPVDWRRLFEVGGNPPAFNRTRSIDTALAIPLRTLPEFMRQQDPETRLAVRNLLRGRLLGLPTGQAVAEAFGAPTLTPQQVRQGPHAEVLQQHGFDKQTPLWYYILKEAEVLHNGERLGPVGSRLLAETFVGLIEGSRTSILSAANHYWKPTLPSQQPGHFTMADLLLFVNDLNPLGEFAPIPEPEPEPEPQPIRHIVQPGESLRAIAARFLGDDMRWREIFNANRDKIRDPDLIHPGVELLIPNGTQPAPQPQPFIHVVQPGDTLRALAQRFLGDERHWRVIRDANRDKISNADFIRPGMELVIPS